MIEILLLATQTIWLRKHVFQCSEGVNSINLQHISDMVRWFSSSQADVGKE